MLQVPPQTASLLDRATAPSRSPKIASVHRTALFSRDRRFRYRLGRRWGNGAAFCFVLLNPSTAYETREDSTVRPLHWVPELRALNSNDTELGERLAGH